MSQNKRVVLLGYIGHGKTSLYNLITQSNEVTKEGGKSVTQRVLIGSSQHLKGFEILDTPGFTIEETMESLSGVLAALYYGDIDRILLVVKYERVKQMMGNINKMFEKIKQLKDIITVVVTKWDKWNKEENPDDQELINSAVQASTGITSIIFCSNPKQTRNSDQKSIAICAQIEQILAQNNQRLTFKATEKVLEHLATPNYIDQDKFDLAGGAINTAFYLIAQCYRKFIQEFDYKNEDALDIMHYLQLAIKKEADQKIDEFIKEYGEKMNDKFDLHSENKQYLLFIKLKQNITLDYQNVIDLSYEKMKQHNINYYTWIKKCPNCQRVWVKVAGCEKDTYCGKRVNKLDKDQQMQKGNNFQKYEFIIMNGKLICQQIQANSLWNAKTALSQYVIENKLVDTKNLDEAIQIIQNKLNENSQLLKLKLQNLLEQFDDLSCRYFSYSFISELQDCMRSFEKFHLCLCFQKEIFDEIKDSFSGFRFLFQKKSDNAALKQKLTLLLQNSQFQNSMDNFLGKITQKNQAEYLRFIRELFQITKQEKSEGCNFKFVWDEQPPLSEQELKALFSPDVFDYVTDRIKLETDDDDATKKELLKTLNLAIGEKLKTVQISHTQQGK